MVRSISAAESSSRPRIAQPLRFALERGGKPELALTQWSRVSEIQPSRTREEHRELYELLSSRADAALEDAYLDSAS